MSFKKIMIVASLVTFWAVTSCSDDDVLPTSMYFNETFPDLDVQTISALETPYEDVFASPAGGRLTEGINLDEISIKLEDIFNGAVILEIETDTERGLAVWEIKLKMPGGGILEVYFVQELGEILKIEGKSGPFDYEVSPGGDFISLTTAIASAKSFKDGDVVKWELELEENNQWEYEIHIENGSERFEVEVNAFTGELISAKEKEEDDDHESEDFHATISQNLEDFIHGYLQGQIIHVEYEMEDLAWNIYVKTEAGGIVEFTVSDDPYSILEIEGEEGPFDYDIMVDGLISLAAAKEIALNHIDGELHEWELQMHSNQWIYEFSIKNTNGEFEVKIDAVTGEIL